MTIFEVVRREVTARQAAELYGLRIDSHGRGFCPWHDDGRHAALQFFPDGGCYCHSCHANGDATDLTAQMLELTPKEAAWRLYKDFHLSQPVDSRPNAEAQIQAKKRRTEREIRGERWDYLCDVVREADAKLAEYSPETIDATFYLLLDARSKADQELNLLWEDIKRERA